MNSIHVLSSGTSPYEGAVVTRSRKSSITDTGVPSGKPGDGPGVGAEARDGLTRLRIDADSMAPETESREEIHSRNFR